eukprot:2767125-Prymnesium_polylepis.1
MERSHVANTHMHMLCVCGATVGRRESIYVVHVCACAAWPLSARARAHRESFLALIRQVLEEVDPLEE